MLTNGSQVPRKNAINIELKHLEGPKHLFTIELTVVSVWEQKFKKMSDKKDLKFWC